MAPGVSMAHANVLVHREHSRRLVAALLGLMLLTGCSRPPQIAPEQFPLIEGLRTAISTRRSDWLESTARLISERHAEGALTDEQFAALDAIVVQARGGQWDEAQSEVMRLAKGQRPGAGDAQRKTDPKP